MQTTSPFMTNPYQTPAFDPKQFQDQPGYLAPSASDFGWVRQVRTFAILNAVQGMLEIPMGLFMTGMSAMFPTLMRMDKQRQADPANAMAEETMMWVVAGVYLAIGIPVLISGVLRVIAGVQNYRFKGRTLGLVSIIAGMATLFSCYCAPTAVGLLVYGLILHLNPAVRAAFELGRQGYSGDQILAGATSNQSNYANQAMPEMPAMPSETGENPFERQ
jgi:uncharacterized membrane protein HdeD (DUF308 family)